jgi:hypothetical protein
MMPSSSFDTIRPSFEVMNQALKRRVEGDKR